jgi:hypothetical protein
MEAATPNPAAPRRTGGTHRGGKDHRSDVVADKPRADLYRDLLPLLNGGRAELLDVQRLVAQLCGLERSTARSGKESINPAPGAQDDLANAVAGVLVLAQAAVPSLWSREQFLVDGRPVAMPFCTDVTFTVLVGGEREIGAVYCCRWQGVLTVLHAELVLPSPPTLDGVLTRLRYLTQLVRSPVAVLFAQAQFAGEYERRGVIVQNIDGLLADEVLPLSVAVHVFAGRVKFVDGILAKAPELLDGSVRGERDVPLRDAFLCAVAVALDDGRRLERAA